MLRLVARLADAACRKVVALSVKASFFSPTLWSVILSAVLAMICASYSIITVYACTTYRPDRQFDVLPYVAVLYTLTVLVTYAALRITLAVGAIRQYAIHKCDPTCVALVFSGDEDKRVMTGYAVNVSDPDQAISMTESIL